MSSPTPKPSVDELLDLMRDPGKDELTAQKCFDALDARCRAGGLPEEWSRHPGVLAVGETAVKTADWEAGIKRIRDLELEVANLKLASREARITIDRLNAQIPRDAADGQEPTND
jgi:hypothetical protein